MAESSPPEFDAVPFERLIAQDRAALVAIANAVVRDPHEAEDIVQETIAAEWQRLPTIAPGKVNHYLCRAIRQNARKRKSRRREHAALEGIVEAAQIDDRALRHPGRTATCQSIHFSVGGNANVSTSRTSEFQFRFTLALASQTRFQQAL